MESNGLKLRFSWKVESSENNLLIQEFISKNCSISPDFVRSLIEFGCVHVGGIRIKDTIFRLKEGDKVDLYLPHYGVKRFYELDPARIIYRDKWILAYNKEPFIPSHQVPYDDYNHVLGAVRRFIDKEYPESYTAIHNRLDVEASGILIFSLDRSINRNLCNIFSGRRVNKTYLLWAEGSPRETEWVCKKSIAKKGNRYCWVDDGEKGKPSETKFTVLFKRESRLLLLAEPVTGRTHQIRIHVVASGLKLYGDKLYGGAPAARLMLHCSRMELQHPVTGHRLSLRAPVPEEFFNVDFCSGLDLDRLVAELSKGELL